MVKFLAPAEQLCIRTPLIKLCHPHEKVSLSFFIFLLYFYSGLGAGYFCSSIRFQLWKKITRWTFTISFSILGKKEFTLPNYEFSYPVTVIRIKLKRNQLGILIGGFYVPTAIFSVLSMISFFINPDVVCWNQLKN